MTIHFDFKQMIHVVTFSENIQIFAVHRTDYKNVNLLYLLISKSIKQTTAHQAIQTKCICAVDNYF